ncbi:hypothetical protein [Arthrobacter sp. HS15c]|uniref:hypothetical protein n=1 Tax=Arthrobacter sp. HS15c TaxID=3230279 RepID=UPI0034659285
MAKKSGKSKGKGHLRSVPSAPKMPLQLVLNHRVVDSLTMEFVQWLGTDGADPSDAVEILELVKLLLTTQHATKGSSSATAFDLDGVDAAAETILAALEEDEIADAVEDIFRALAVYIEFLDESGRWSGTEAAYEELQSFLATPGGPEDVPGRRPIDVPHLSTEEQDTAFNALPLIQRASSLLEWIGEGKDVTTTGALRLKDIEAAAAAVGVNARGKHGAGKPADPDGVHGNQDAPLEVGTMYDVPLLGDTWAALVRAGLLTLGSTRAVVGPDIDSWNSTDAGERVRARRRLTLSLLLANIANPDEPWKSEDMDPLLLIVLARGTDVNPMPVAQLEQLAADDEDPHYSFLALRAKNKLAALEELGIVEVDTSYRVARVAIQCVASAMKIIEGQELLSDADDPEYNDAGFTSNVFPLLPSAGAPKRR